jgi:putative ABC transport system permease protein
VRLALGAQLSDILSLILGAGFRLALLGAGLGLLGSIGMNVLMGALFNNGSVKALSWWRQLDYITLPLTTVLLVLVSLLACYLPARHATKIDPLTALRNE